MDIDIVSKAWKAHLAILAFNVPYLPMVKPIIQAIVDQDAVAMVATARLEWVKFQSRSLAAVAEEYQRWYKPDHTWLHLDHVPVIDEDNITVNYLPIFKEAIDLGYQSVMIDGSRLQLSANVEATQRVVELAQNAGIPCEAELGAVFGHESGPLPSYEELFASQKGFTDPDEASDFVRATRCHWLSVAVGNIHGSISGVLKDQPKVEARISVDRVDQIAKSTRIPLVLHGGSGIQQQDVTQAISRGVAKINIGTEIRQSYEVALRQTNDIHAAQQAVLKKPHLLYATNII